MARTTGNRAFMIKEGSNSSILHFVQHKTEYDISQPGGLVPRQLELLNSTFQDWRINQVKTREPKQGSAIWCRSSSPPKYQKWKQQQTGFEFMLKRRERVTLQQQPQSEMSLSPMQRTGELASSLHQHHTFRSHPRDKQAGEEGWLWSPFFFLNFFFRLFFFFSSIKRHLSIGSTSY